MVENVITNKVQIEGYENIKQLKDEIAKLRKEMVGLADESEAQKKKANELAQAEFALKQAMSANRKDTSALIGSYNQLQNQLTALKKVWKETNDETTRNEIGQQIAVLDERLKTLDSSVGVHTRNVGNYRSALKGLREELYQLPKGTEEYTAKLREAAEMTHEIREQQQMLTYASSDLGDQLSNITQIGAGLASGFAAVNAAMGLFGSESEDLQKVLVKVQQTMALMQGLQGLDGLLKRTKGLSVALGLTTKATVNNTIATKNNNKAKAENVALTEAQRKSELDLANARKVGTIEIEKADKAQKGFFDKLGSNPIALLTAAIAATTVAVTKTNSKMKELLGGVDMLPVKIASLEAAREKAFQNYLKALDKSERATKRAKEKLDKYDEALTKLREQQADAVREQTSEIAKSYEWEIKENEARLGSDYKYTKEGAELYRKYLNAKILSYKKDSDEYKQALIEKMSFETQYTNHWEEIRIAAYEKEKARILDLTKNWENMVFNLAATDEEIIYNTNQERIKAWNDFIETIPEEQRAGLIIPSESEFGEKLQELAETFKGDFVKPLIKRVKDDVGALTDESLDIVKVAKDRYEEALTKSMFDAIYEAQVKLFNKQSASIKILNERDKASQEFSDNMYKVSSDVQIRRAEQSYKALDTLYQNNINKLNEFLKQVENIFPKDSKAYKEYLRNTMDLITQLQGEQLKNTADFEAQRSDILKQSFLTRFDEEKTLFDREVKLKQGEYEKYASTLDLLGFKNGNLPKQYAEMLDEVSTMQENFYLERMGQIETLLKDERLVVSDKKELETEWLELKMEYEDIALQHTLDNNERTREAFKNTFNAIKDSAGGMSTIFNTVGNSYKEMLERQRDDRKVSDKEWNEGFQTYKGIQVAQTIANTLSSSMAAYQSLAGIPYVGPALGAAAAAAAIAYGMQQVKTLQALQPNRNSSLNQNTVQASATPAIRDYEPTTFRNLTGAKETEDLKNAIINQPLWISVVDIDKAQDKVKIKDKETTF